MAVSIAMLGSSHSGKSALLHSHLFNSYPHFYTSTHDSILQASGPPVQTYIDLPGSLTIDKPLSLRLVDANTFIICFSLVDRRTMEEAESIWCPLAQNCNQNAKLLLVGCMKDIRPRLVPLSGPAVPAEEGRLLAGRFDAEYMECSALTEEGVKEVFSLAVELAMEME
jgi:GTPase SAR1 family protein